MSSLEAALEELDRKVKNAEAAASALAKALKRAGVLSKAGNVAQLERQFAALPDLRRSVADAVGELDGSWTFGTREHLESGYAAELLAAAQEAGLSLFEKDGRLFAFPYIIRLLPGDSAIRIGPATERAIRPKVVIDKLKALVGRPQKTSEARFLELLYKAYQRLAGADWRRVEQGSGPEVRLTDIHEIITLLPSADYSPEEFGRDLLLLDRQAELNTRDGASFILGGSAMGRGGKKIVIYDEVGNTREFIAIKFTKRN